MCGVPLSVKTLRVMCLTCCQDNDFRERGEKLVLGQQSADVIQILRRDAEVGLYGLSMGVCDVVCGIVWCGVVWYGVVRCGVVWCAVLHGMAWCSVVQMSGF